MVLTCCARGPTPPFQQFRPVVTVAKADEGGSSVEVRAGISVPPPAAEFGEKKGQSPLYSCHKTDIIGPPVAVGSQG